MRLSAEWHAQHWILGLTWGRETFPSWPGTRNLRLHLGPLSLRLSWPLPAPPPAENHEGWLCGCGNYQDNDFCCAACGNRPPWGCDCGMCSYRTEEAEEDDEYEDGTYP